jgi:hypothetical protein
MLGYITPDKPELKIKEYEVYGGYYCGICKSIGRRYGQIPRLVLSYDSVFLALILAGINPNQDHIKVERCIVHPMKKRSIVYDNPEIDYAADILLLLAYFKMKDDYQDEKKKKAAVGAILLRRVFKSLSASKKEKCRIVKDKLEELSALEKEKCPSIDRSAEPFAKLMEEVFDTGDQEDLRQVYRRIGYHIGKWIYLVDAFDDIEDNDKNNAYNPLICQFGYLPEKETAEEFRNRIRERVERNLLLYLAEIAKSCEQLNFEKNKGLIENIIYFGLMRKTEEILQKGNKKDAEPVRNIGN